MNVQKIIFQIVKDQEDGQFYMEIAVKLEDGSEVFKRVGVAQRVVLDFSDRDWRLLERAHPPHVITKRTGS